MAIFHLSVKAVSRSDGRSATAAAAYRAGCVIADERTGEIHDYTRRGGVESATIVLPDGAPEWATDRARLWNAAELAEKRKDACVAREFEVALPCELPPAARRRLALDFAKDMANREGCAVDVAIHAPGKEGDNRNHHAHILRTTRKVEAHGLGAKLDTEKAGRKRADDLEAARSKWADLCNAALEAHGFSERVDHRSNEARGLEGLPTVKVGRRADSAERRQHNAELRALNHHLAEALAERAAAAAAEKVAAADQAARDQAERIAAAQAQADYAAALEQRALVERRAARVRAWRAEAEDRIGGLAFQAASLPTEAERKRARAQLATARRSNDQAQRELEKATRAARSSRWWNPISVYRALIAHRDLPVVEHRAGALAHALEVMERAASSPYTREDAQKRVEQLRQQLQENQVPEVPALPAPPALRGQRQDAVDLPPQDETQAYDRPRGHRG